MIYVMSDIHGEYDKYRAMLEKIAFCDEDVLYVLGDVIDRGPDSVKLLRDMSMRPNVYPLLGNHEYMALDVLGDLLVEITQENHATHIGADTIEKLSSWQLDGGDRTLSDLQRLSIEDREALMEYLREFSLYEVVPVGDRTYVLVHSSPEKPNNGRKLSEYSAEELVFSRSDYSCAVFSDPSVFVVSGHTPTMAITGEKAIAHINNHICIDCGAAFGGVLACLRLDDLREFYV